MSMIYEQAAALPVRLVAKNIQILLVQTRSGDKWTIPKGIIDPGFTAQETALAEAYEEAGLKGALHPEIFGTFSYSKWQGTCIVQVFLMKVYQELIHWPERYFRERKWVNLEQSARMLKYPALSKIIDKINKDTLNSAGFWKDI
ncbi:MAG: NUDIX hydrolase [bacterium]|nr:MAG: NUDIX hydrolase [bacterium]